jgi:hypothetical protein
METIQFEAVKLALKQDKNGYVLTLLMHPDEVPEEILRDFVGARYQVVAVRLNEDQTPYPRKTNGVVSAAGILCRNKRFWEWLEVLGEITQKSEEQAVEALHSILGIKSRSELTNPDKQEKWDLMIKEYESWDVGNPPF